ncbi:2-amino-4-hydroxy-6-hydroxymethyldihydropteridine diphosphokinase [Clostridium sp.]|uniref:2-amino-4-hydroxy-6- hydroxymethyldihydropteridine diphosphokinase n=1 Tax=Clostridium sp. TaxID=1506 RepID=UPI003463B5E4
MDRILIKDLEIYAHHGVFKEEKTLGQKFLITMELYLSLREPGKTGDLDKSVHYGELSHKVEEEFKRKSYDLIEEAAENLAEFILKEYDIIEKVEVSIKKPWAPILKPLDYVEVKISRGWHRAYIALGSNMGNKKENLNNALKLMESHITKVIKVSEFITTEPWGYENQDEFLNGVCEVRTLLSPEELMDLLLRCEKELKRERIIKWGPRTIDLDILLYDHIITEGERVVIPHPRMEERAFVLDPLSEIAPYYVHPILNKRIIDIKKQLERN